MVNTVLSQHLLARRTLSVGVAERGCHDMTCLIDWIGGTSAIENVVLGGGAEVMANVFRALRSSNCVIRRAWFAVPLRSSADVCMHMLPALSKIETCVLSGLWMGRGISLSFLTSLLTLTSLVLEDGLFTELDAAEHLTCLSLIKCRAFCSQNCTFVSCLVKLELTDSRLEDLHDGPAMCSRLQSLFLSGACITWGLGVEDLIFDVDIPFEGLSTLTALIALTQLHVTIGDDGCQLTPDLSQLYRLTKLRCLSLTVSMHVKFSQGLQDLSCLTCLRLRGHRPNIKMVFDVDWKALVDLRHFELTDALVLFECDLSELAPIRTLEKVTLRKLEKSDMHTRRQIANLAHRFGLLKSGAEFVID